MAETEVTRAEFEQFAIRNTYHLQAFEGFYASPYTQSAWESWQESRQSTAKAIAQKLRDRADQHDNAGIDSNSGSAAQYEMLRMNLATSRALRALADETEREYEVKL